MSVDLSLMSLSVPFSSTELKVLVLSGNLLNPALLHFEFDKFATLPSAINMVRYRLKYKLIATDTNNGSWNCTLGVFPYGKKKIGKEDTDLISLYIHSANDYLCN